MSDAARKDFSAKAKEELTPDVMKSDQQKMKEAVTDTADKTAREAQSDGSKSKTQDASDKVNRASDNVKHGSTHESITDKVKAAVGLDKDKHPNPA